MVPSAGQQADRDQLEAPLSRREARRPSRPAQARSTAGDRRGADRGGDTGGAAGAPGVTHWSSRLLGAELGLSHVTVVKVWKKWNLQPWRSETFKFSADPDLEAKVRDVVGLYLNPPDKACRRTTSRVAPRTT